MDHKKLRAYGKDDLEMMENKGTVSQKARFQEHCL